MTDLTVETDPMSDCSCPDYRASRRGVLKGLGLAAGTGAVTSLTGGVFRQVAFGATDQPTLVVLSLRGGADGLSMVVPYGDPAYAAARPRIAVPQSQLIAKDGFFGLHPSFAPLLPMWNAGKMAAVQAVGLPAPNRSHFVAMEEVEDADPGSSERVGWLNRMVGLAPSAEPTDGFSLGSAMLPTSLYGPMSVLGVGRTKDLRLPGATSGPLKDWKRASLGQAWQDTQTPLGAAALAALTASETMAPLVATQPRPANGAAYPTTPFGDVMRDTARLLKAGLGVKAVTVDFGNWDMHVNLGTLTQGTMAPKIKELSQGIAAFYQDLGTFGDRTTLVTITEFGRRVSENANLGLDHGFASCMLAFGGGVRGGKYYSQWPGLGTSQRVNGDLRVTRDYRSILTEVLRSRTSTDTTKVFPRFSPEAALGFMA